jgi:hypothetical protein
LARPKDYKAAPKDRKYRVPQLENPAKVACNDIPNENPGFLPRPLAKAKLFPQTVQAKS